MRTALPAADWLTRAAWGLSAAIHVGAAAAFIGWSPPPRIAPQAIAVTLVAMAPAPDLEVGSTEIEVAPPERAEPAAASSAAAGDVESPVTEPLAPEPVAPEPIAPDPEPTAPEPPTPEPRADQPPAAESAAAAPALPLPATKPPAPEPVAERRAAEAPAKPSPATEAPAEIRTQSAMTAPPAAAPGGVEPGGAPEMTPARLDVAGLANPDPAYPMTSRMRREEGTVLLEVTVSPAGTVSAIRVVESSGHSRLDKAALEAVRSWRFVPARLGDRPIEAVIRHRVVFRLDS